MQSPFQPGLGQQHQQPPPGLTRPQNASSHHPYGHGQQQQQQQQQPQHQSPLGSSPWQTFVPGAGAGNQKRGNAGLQPGANGRSSAAVPIMRPDGSVPTSAPVSPLPGARAALDPSNQSVSSENSGTANATAAGGGGGGGLSRAAAGAAVFVPKTKDSSTAGNQAAPPSTEFRGMDITKGGQPSSSSSSSSASSSSIPFGRSGPPPVFTPSGRGTPSFTYEGSITDGSTSSNYDSSQGYPGQPMSEMPPMQATNQPPQPPRPFNPYEHMDQSGNYDDGSNTRRQPLQYHLQAPPLPHTSNLHPHHLAQAAYFMSPTLRQDLFRRNDAINASAPSVQELGGTQTRPPHPTELHVYKDLVPLEPDASGPLPYGSRGNPTTIGGVPTQLLPRHLLPISVNGLIGGVGMGSLSNLPVSSSGGPLAPSNALGGWRTEVHRAICTLDGKPYALRRISGFTLSREKEKALENVERWRRLRCPGVVNVREAFTTWRWNSEPSIIFVYDYHPLSSTLFAEHLLPKPPRVDPRTGRMERVDDRVPERVLWSYVVQLASALRAIHKQGLAARCIDASKILKTGKNRVRINCCSVLDVLAYDPAQATDVARLQRQDLYQLGVLILTLGCLNAHAGRDTSASLQQLSRNYSQELLDVTQWLLYRDDGSDDDEGKHNSDALFVMLAPRLADELSSAQSYGDLMEDALSKELENGRLVRLLCKLGFINERPEFDRDPSWSSTGERYAVSLFRDYVFHSIDETGKPVLDLSHVLSHLNRLDAGSRERIALTSRDEQSCLVVSYREVKDAIESAFSDLLRHAA